MSPVPPPRDPAEATTVLGMVNDGLREVKEALTQLSRDVNRTFSQMPRDYVPRQEAERRWDDQRSDLGALDQRVTAERTDRKADIASLEARHTASRRFAITTAITAIGAVLGDVIAIIALHH